MRTFGGGHHQYASLKIRTGDRYLSGHAQIAARSQLVEITLLSLDMDESTIDNCYNTSTAGESRELAQHLLR